MRLIPIFHIIISASLLAVSADAVASIAKHKAGKSKKSRHSAVHKHAAHRDSGDIWERIRKGMQIPRPQPVAVNPIPTDALISYALHQMPVDTSPSSKPLPAKIQHLTQCAPARANNNRQKTLSVTKTTRVSQSEIKPARIHVQLQVKPKIDERMLAQELENLSPEDAMETLEALTRETASGTPATGKQAPCSKEPPQQVANAVTSGINAEESLQQKLKYERVQKFIVRYSQNPGFLAQVTKRARPYLYHIVESLSKSKMPMELALLPIVESAYQPKAESPKHAAGLWQFIPSTGRDFNLDQTEHYDDRLDIVESTEAAIRYLRFLKQHFNGDWLLALAAYNCGLGTVDDAMSRNRENSMATDYWSLQLPEETQDYVPRLLALSSILANPTQHKVKLTKIKNEPYFVKVDVAHEIDIKHLINKDFEAIAKLADLSYDQFSLLNPGYLTEALTPEHPFTFLIPVSNVKQLNQHLRTLSRMIIDYQNNIPPFSFVASLLAEPALTKFDAPFFSLDLERNGSLTPNLTNDPLVVASVMPATNVPSSRKSNGYSIKT